MDLRWPFSAHANTTFRLFLNILLSCSSKRKTYLRTVPRPKNSGRQILSQGLNNGSLPRLPEQKLEVDGARTPAMAAPKRNHKLLKSLWPIETFEPRTFLLSINRLSKSKINLGGALLQQINNLPTTNFLTFLLSINNSTFRAADVFVFDSNDHNYVKACEIGDISQCKYRKQEMNTCYSQRI